MIQIENTLPSLSMLSFYPRISGGNTIVSPRALDIWRQSRAVTTHLHHTSASMDPMTSHWQYRFLSNLPVQEKICRGWDLKEKTKNFCAIYQLLRFEKKWHFLEIDILYSLPNLKRSWICNLKQVGRQQSVLCCFSKKSVLLTKNIKIRRIDLEIIYILRTF